jgi:hypothetical protein
MGAYSGPRTIEDGLIFYYDMSNIDKSFVGAPTTNILPSPSTNGRFMGNNGWGTYSVSKYNSATYFSIGTISSVVGNVVTTVATHPFETFDSVVPETAGGGLTTTTYFVNKLSDTTFTLHAYNSSQDGSQGYLIPGTSFHKVHENIQTDTRVSINATSFPTSWKGLPHQPNRTLVKETIEGGGVETGTNCLRLHMTRVDDGTYAGSVDGLAYQVYTPVTSGDTIHASYWMRGVYGPYGSTTHQYGTYFGSGFSQYYANNQTVTSEWKKFENTWTASNTLNFYQYWFLADSTSKYAVDISDIQVEINGDTWTPWADGTRSTTQSIFDMSKNKHNVTVNSITTTDDYVIEFDGAADYLTLPNDIGYTTAVSAFAWFKRNGVPGGGYHIILGGQELEISILDTSDYLRTGLYSTTRQVSNTASNIGIVDGNWHHIGFTFDGTTKQAYIDGVAIGSGQTITGTLTSSFANRTIGKFGSNATYWANGEIGITQIYDRSLNASEVKTLFNSMRKRYNV